MAVAAYWDPAQVSAASCGYHPSARARREGLVMTLQYVAGVPGRRGLWVGAGSPIHNICVLGFVTVAVCKGLEGRLGIGDTES